MNAATAVRPVEDLERLLEVEQRLETLLAQARRDAARLVQDAETAGAARDRAVEAEVIAATSALDARIQADRERREQDVAAAALRDATRYDQVPVETIARLARLVVERLLAGEVDA